MDHSPNATAETELPTDRRGKHVFTSVGQLQTLHARCWGYRVTNSTQQLMNTTSAIPAVMAAEGVCALAQIYCAANTLMPPVETADFARSLSINPVDGVVFYE